MKAKSSSPWQESIALTIPVGSDVDDAPRLEEDVETLWRDHPSFVKSITQARAIRGGQKIEISLSQLGRGQSCYADSKSGKIVINYS